jgi:high-affinity iron transporter
VSFLVRGSFRNRLPALWSGVAVAVLFSLGFGAILYFTSTNMTFEAQETFGGSLSILAVGFVTWMVFWMRRASRTLKTELQDKMHDAIRLGPLAVALAAMLAVGREGLETALFLYPTFEAQGAGAAPAVGAVLGITTAVVLGWLLYRGAVHLDLARFFRYTGAALIVIASGVLAYGVHDLQEAQVLPGLERLALDFGFSGTSWFGTLLKGVFNISPQMTVLEVGVYLAYLVPTMWLFLRAPAAAPRTRRPAGALAEG